MNDDKWKCPLCGGTKIGIRNYYKNQPEDTVGFTIEEYCDGCGIALSSIPHILETKKYMEKHLKEIVK
jgi:hypothetical protein